MKTVLTNYVEYIPKALDPLAAKDFPEVQILRNISETLTRIHSENEVVLNLLESSAVSFDGMTFRFTLIKGIKFHDGSEVTADDVVCSLEKVLNNKTSASQLHLFVAKGQNKAWAVQRLSRYRFEVQLIKKCPDILLRFSSIDTAIMSHKTGVFCGKWKLKEHLRDLIELEPFDNGLATIDSPYELIKIKPYALNEEFNFNINDQAYVFCYPGYQFKTPKDHMLADSFCSELQAWQSHFFIGESEPKDRKQIETSLVSLFEKSLKPNLAYRRESSKSLAPKDHVLYKRNSHGYIETEQWDSILSKVDLDFGDLPEKLKQQVYEAIHDRSLGEGGQVLYKLQNFTLFGTRDYLLPLKQLADIVAVKNRKLLSIYGENLVRESFRVFAVLDKLASIVPLMISPMVIRSNREILDCKHLSFVPYEKVRASSKVIESERLEEETVKSIGKALPMLAHDIKKPFSMVQTILEIIESTSDPERIKKIVSQYVPEIKKNIRLADQLIQDVLEIGSTSEPYRENVGVRELIKSSLDYVRVMTVTGNVELEFDFNISKSLNVDIHKVTCVFNNLFSNAIQAMNNKGRIWVKAYQSPSHSKFAEIVVGNSGPAIDSEDLPYIFDRFFTKDKKGGTGLGLAIVKKIVEAHGGRIECKSDGDGTEFVFTLPLSKTIDDSKIVLPIELISGTHKDQSDITSQFDVKAGSDRIKLLFVDDDNVYAEMLREIALAINPNVDITYVDSQKAFENKKSQAFDLAIIDVFIVNDQPLGLSLASELKELQPDCLVCAHSSGNPITLQKQSMQLGLDLFFPKPMTKQFLGYLMKLSNKNRFQEKMRLLVVDDDAIFVEGWQNDNAFSVKTYFSSKECLNDIKSNKLNLKEIDAIVTDQNFAPDEIKGVEMAKEIKLLGFKGPIFVSTELPMPGLSQAVTEQVGKEYKKIRNIILEYFR